MKMFTKLSVILLATIMFVFQAFAVDTNVSVVVNMRTREVGQSAYFTNNAAGFYGTDGSTNTFDSLRVAKTNYSSRIGVLEVAKTNEAAVRAAADVGITNLLNIAITNEAALRTAGDIPGTNAQQRVGAIESTLYTLAAGATVKWVGAGWTNSLTSSTATNFTFMFGTHPLYLTWTNAL